MRVRFFIFGGKEISQVQEGRELNRVGDYLTLKAAAKEKHGSYWGLYFYIRRNTVPVQRIGKSILVRLSDVEGYTPRERPRKD